MIWNAIKGFILPIVSFLGLFAAGFFSGRNSEKTKQLKNQLEAANDRGKIEDDNSKLGPIARRRLLGKWSVPDVQADPANDD
jgi:hypothetical protein